MCSPGGGEERHARGQPSDDVTKTSLRLLSRHDVTRTSPDVTKICLDRIGVNDVITTSSNCLKDRDVNKTSYNRVDGYNVTDRPNKPCRIKPHTTCGHHNHTSTSYHKGFNRKTSEDSCCCRQRCTDIKSGIINASISGHSGNDTNNNSCHNTGLSCNRKASKRNRSSPDSLTRSPLIVSRLKLDARPQHPLLLLLLLLLACSSSSSTARGPFVAAHCEKGVKFFNDQRGVCEPCSECLLPYIKIIPCYEYQDTTCATPGDYFDVKGREGSQGTPTAVQEEVGQNNFLGRRRGDGGVGRRGGDGGGRNNTVTRGRKRNRVRNKDRRGEGKNRNNRNRGNRGRKIDGGIRENPNHWGSDENRLEEEFPRPHQDSDDNYLGRNGHSNLESDDVVGDFEANQKHWEIFKTEEPRRHSGVEGSVRSPTARNGSTSFSVSPKRSDFSVSSAVANSTEDIILTASVHKAGSAPAQGNETGMVVSNSPSDPRGAVLPPSSTSEDEDASLRLSLREMVSSGWTAAVIVCAALLLGLLAIALLLLLGLNLLIHFKNKIVSHLKEKRSEEGSSDGAVHTCPSTAVLMHHSPSSLSSSPSSPGKLPKKPKKLGRGLGRVPSGKVLVARTYKLAPGGRGDKLDSSNSSSSGCAMRQSTSTVLTSADTFLSGGSDGTFCAETTLMSETSSGRHGDFHTSAKETSFSFDGKETIFNSERGGGKESNFGFVSTSVTPAVGPHARWSSRSSSTPNTASLWSAKQHDDKLLAATLPLVGGGHGTQPAPMHVVNSVVTNNIVTFGDGSTVSTTTNYSANAADGDSNLNYPYAHTLPTTYIRTSTRTQALLNNSSLSGTFNGNSQGSPGVGPNVGPSIGSISGGPHPTAEPLQPLTSVSEAKGSPIPYTMDKLLEQRRRLGCTSSVDTNIYVEMWRGSSAAPSNAPSAAPSPALHRSNNTAPTGGRGNTFTPSTGGPLDRSARHTSDDQRTAFVIAVQRDLNNLSINNSCYNSNYLAQGNTGLNDLNCGGDRVAVEGGNLGNGGPLVLVGRSANNSPALQRHFALGGGKLSMVSGNTNNVLANNINHTVGNSVPGYGGPVVGGATGSPPIHAGRLMDWDRPPAHLNSIPASGGQMPASPGPARRHFR